MNKITSMLLTCIVAIVFALSNAFATDLMTGGNSTKVRYVTGIIGAAVSNLQGEKLGIIIDLTIDQNRITFAVLSHGGIFGIGEKIIPIPIDALIFKGDKTLLIDISENKLAKAPSFEKSQRPDFSNRQWTEDTYRFYGAQPFWKKGSAEPTMEEEYPVKERLKEKMQHSLVLCSSVFVLTTAIPSFIDRGILSELSFSADPSPEKKPPGRRSSRSICRISHSLILKVSI